MQWIFDISELEWASCGKIQLKNEYKFEYILDQPDKHFNLCTAPGQERFGNRIQ